MENKSIFNIYNFILICILLLGFVLRVYRLPNIPSGFFCDEASIGVNAYTILIKGTDEHGAFFPVFFQAFGEYKSPIQIYTTVPFIALFGLNEFAVRLPSVIFGTLSIFSIYLLTKELFSRHSGERERLQNRFWTCQNDKVISLFAAFFLAISPWHIHFSRVAFELMPFVFFTTFGLYLFLKFRDNTKFLFISSITFTFALYSYFPARIFIPLFGLGVIIIYNRFFLKHKKQIFLNFILLLFLLTPLILFTLSPSGFARWNQVNIFTSPPKDETITAHIINNYISHFSLDFLFFKGDIDMPGQFVTRHSIRGIGELYLFQFPLILLSILFLWKNKERKILLLLAIWLLFYPIGSMFTVDKNAQATRSIIGVIPFQILSAIGLWWIMNLLRCFETFKIIHFLKIVVLGTTVFIIIFSFLRFFNLYFIKYPLYSSDFWGWQYGPKETMKYFLSVKNNYDELYMSGEFNSGDIFLKFYDPKNTCQNKCMLGDLWRNPEIYNPQKRQLFSLSPEYLKNSSFANKFSIKKIIYYPNNTIAFQIGEIVQ